MNLKLKFLCFQGIHYSLPSFWAKLGYSWIKIDHIADSLLKLQIKIGVHFINVELSQLLTLEGATTLLLAPSPDFQTFLRPCVGSEVLDHAHGSAIICTRVILIMMKVKNAHHLIIKWYRSLISIPYRNSTYAFRSLHCMTHLMRNIFFPSSKDDSLKIDAIQCKRIKVRIVIIAPKNVAKFVKEISNHWTEVLNELFTILGPSPQDFCLEASIYKNWIRLCWKVC